METKTDFREVLKQELSRRMNRNPRYSLRAFAKDLKLAPPLLSDVMNGKRGLSRASALRLAQRLGLSPDEQEIFSDLVESKHARSRMAKMQAAARLTARLQNGSVLKFLTLGSEEFSLVAEWYPLAILELMKTKDFEDRPEWIAKRLAVNPVQIETALDRLERFNLIVREDGVRKLAGENVQTPDGIPSGALRAHHEEFMKKGLEALHTQPLEERDFRGLTVRCRKSDVPHVRARLRKFLHDLDAELSANPESDEVYQLSTQFFCLTVPVPTSGENL